MSSKIIGLRTWLDTYQAADVLSKALNEPVNNIDVLRLALDGHLVLSAHFVNSAYGRPCKRVRPDEVEWKELPTLDGKGTINVPSSGHTLLFGQDLYLVAGDVRLLDGTWDLPMIGGEVVDVEFQFHQLSLHPTPTAVSLEGVLIQSDEGDLFEVQHRASSLTAGQPASFHPAGALPEDHVLVVRRANLDRFIQQHSALPAPVNDALTARERTTLLNIIGALLEMNGGKEAGIIGDLLDRYLDKPGIKKRTLEEKFAEAKRSLNGT